MIKLTYTNTTNESVDEKIFTSLLPKIKANGEVSLTIVDDEKIAELNEKYRGKKGPTDVISFAYNETEKFPGEEMLGEIYISIDAAKKQRDDLEQELKFLCVHGILHLLGHTHETAGKYDAMMALTKKIIGCAEGAQPNTNNRFTK